MIDVIKKIDINDNELKEDNEYNKIELNLDDKVDNKSENKDDSMILEENLEYSSDNEFISKDDELEGTTNLYDRLLNNDKYIKYKEIILEFIKENKIKSYKRSHLKDDDDEDDMLKLLAEKEIDKKIKIRYPKK